MVYNVHDWLFFDLSQDAHDAPQVVFISKWNRDFTLPFGRGRELYLGIQHAGKLLLIVLVGLGELCLSGYLALSAFYIFPVFEKSYHVFNLSHGVCILHNLLVKLDLKSWIL